MSDPWTITTLRELHTSADTAPAYSAPNRITAPGRSFFVELSKALSVIMLLTDVAVLADNAAVVANKVVGWGYDLPKNFEPNFPHAPTTAPLGKKLRYLSESLLEMILIRLVDNFTTYLSGITRECLKVRSDILRPDETVTLEIALACDNAAELREALVDRKLDELTYLGLDKLTGWINERLGIGQIGSFPAKARLLEILEIRQCLVYNRGLTNSKYIRTVLGTGKKLGERVEVSINTIFLAARATSECITLMDEALAAKFALPRVPL